MTPIQPPDETPIPASLLVPSTDPRFDRVPEIAARLDDAYGAIEDEAANLSHGVHDALDATHHGMSTAVAGIMGGVDRAVTESAGKIGAAVKRIDTAANKNLDNAVDSLAEAGAVMPYQHQERVVALNDPTDTLIPASVLPAVELAYQLEPGTLTGKIQTDPGNTTTPGPAPTDPAPTRPPIVIPMPATVPPSGPCSSTPGAVFFNGGYWIQYSYGVQIDGLPGVYQPLGTDCQIALIPLVPPPVPPPPVPPVPPIGGTPIIVPSPPIIVTPPPVPPGPVPPSPPAPGPVPVPPVPPAPPAPSPYPVTYPGATCPAPVINVTCPPATTTPPVVPPPPVPPGTTPPPPGSPPTTPPSGGPDIQTGNVVDWSLRNACSTAEAACEHFLSEPSPPSKPGGSSSPPSSSIFGQVVDTVVALTFPEAAVAGELYAGWKDVQSILKQGTSLFFPLYLPNPAAAAYFAGHIGAMEWAGRVTGAPMDYLSTWAQYELHYCNPLTLPSQGELNSMFMVNTLSDKEWECYTKAQGNMPELARNAMQAGQAKPNPNETVQAYMRGIIPTAEEFEKRMRANGILDPKFTAEFYKLAQQIPTVSDLVTWMKRDAADENVVRKFNYDFEFVDKFTGDMPRWAKMNGYDEQFMRMAWRAHWQIPSNTQLYEMLHRQREDRAEVIQYIVNNPGADYNNPDAWPADAPAVTTAAMVREALEVNDNAPGWIGRLMATSYHPITNSDARRAYILGSFDDDELTSRMLDNGYNKADSTTLVKFFQSEKSKTIAAQTGVLSLRKLVRMWKDGGLSTVEFLKGMEPIIPDAKTRQGILDNTTLERTAEDKLVCIKATKKAYLYGELNDSQATAKLAGFGVDPLQVVSLIPRWRCEKQNRLKEPRVAMLCEWFTSGLITADDYISRLMNMGYTDRDAYRIAAVCYRTEMIKRWQQQIKNSKELIAEWRRQMKEQHTDMTQAIKDEQDRIKNWQKQVAQWQKELAAQSGAPPAPSTGGATQHDPSSPPPVLTP